MAASELARLLARRLDADPPQLVDLAVFGPAVLDPHHPAVGSAAHALRRASVAVIASPAHGGAHTELLTTFLRRLRGNGLERLTAVPMLVASPRSFDHVGDTLRPILVGLGATCPAPSLIVRESDVARLSGSSSLLRTWADRHASTVRATVDRRRSGGRLPQP